MIRMGALLGAWLLTFVSVAAAAWSPPAPLESDETVIVFPTLVTREAAPSSADAAAAEWVVFLRGWVFERELDSDWRGEFIEEVGEELGLTDEEIGSSLFQTRARGFLSDNERGEEVQVEVAGRVFTLPETNRDGHSQIGIRLTDAELRGAAGEPVPGKSRSLELKVLNAGRAEVICPPARVVEPDATIVVCDIDDTIKISNIGGDKAGVVQTALVEPFRPVPGMADLCNRFAATGAAFWYLSASPWQLYEPLDAFLTESGFPRGGITLREFRWKDERFFNLFEDPREFKLTELRRLLERFDGHRFVLIGDTTEHDAEVYAAIAREFPGRVARVVVRATPGDEVGKTRAQKAMMDLPAGVRVDMFEDPGSVQPGASEAKEGE